MVGRIGIHSRRQWIEYVEKHYRGASPAAQAEARPEQPRVAKQVAFGRFGMGKVMGKG